MAKALIREQGRRGLRIGLIAALRFVPALLWVTFIFAVSSRSRLPPAPVSFEGLDKILHAGAYGVLAMSLLFAFGWPRGKLAWLCAMLAALYGITDEVHQSFVPHRHADLFDWVADVSGAVFVVAAYLKQRTFHGRSPEKVAEDSM